MKSKSRVGGDVEIVFAMFTAPTFTRWEKVGLVANATMRTADITNIVKIFPIMHF